MTHEELIDMLPHGSGINCDWKVEETRTSVRASNSFHTMTEMGYYDGYQDFVLIFPKNKPLTEFRLQFTGSRYLARKYSLRDFLEDTIYWALKDALDAETPQKENQRCM